MGSITEQAEVRQPFTEGVWTNVKLMYDGSTVTAQVDGSSKTAPLQGNINTRYNGIMIGSCHGRGFVGYIDDVHLYRCLLK
ncbi:uncharacterized shell protein 26-like [Ruditapes philippinarum]|uniref:uncharacterized shell protein 26-like n=1 Tax=Ruditapes philippinarum TaxID=129788 RepID=UPI00295BAADF|nr:uncharacterized shell protein 26-like [Ruditapes philippinarum]